VALDGAARIEGRLSAADGGELPVLVVLQRADGNTQGPAAEAWNAFAFMLPVAAAGDRTASVKDGKFSFDHVPPGSVRLVVREIGKPTAPLTDLATLPLELQAGDVARPELTVQFPRGK
jgi:hypothetical protein